MSTSDDLAFDVSTYTRPPPLNVASAVGLGTALLHALPKPAPPPVLKAAKRLRAAVVALQERWHEAGATITPGDPRPADHALDGAWALLEARLASYAALDANRYPAAARAAELHERLFPDGLSWLKLPFTAEWAESKKRLDLIAREKLTSGLALVVGQEFLEEVERAHAQYGDAIGITKPRASTPSPARLDEPLRAVARAVTFYATQVAATVDPDDDASSAAARKALQPIDDLRAAQTRRGRATPSTDAPPPAPTSPVPAVPAAS